MLLSQNLVKEALWKASSTGADYAEVFAEYTNSKTISMVSSKVDKIADGVISGVGIRIFKGTRCVSGSTSSLLPEAILNCAQKVADALNGAREMETIVLSERRFGDIHLIRIVPTSVENATKIDLLREASETAKNYHSDISQVTGTFLDVDHNIMIATTEGLLTEDRQIRTRMALSAVASKNGENQTGSCSPGGRMGMEFYELHDPKSIGEEAARQAMVMINAGYIPAGKMPVAIGNGFGGVIFHEACGHGLEASGVALGQSVFGGKLGEQIANTKVTAIDDATIPNGWGSINIDDEGTPGEKTILIENGILKGYLVDYRNSRRMNHPITGSSRRQNYRFAPTSRMTNTFFAPGKDKFEDIIKNTKYGLFAKKMGGGSVNPSTGEFNFAVNEGYMIEDGKITRPVRGATLIGSGTKVLLNIDMIADNLAFGHGMCGSASGSIPTDVGQPTIRVQNMVVGGRGEK